MIDINDINTFKDMEGYGKIRLGMGFQLGLGLDGFGY